MKKYFFLIIITLMLANCTPVIPAFEAPTATLTLPQAATATLTQPPRDTPTSTSLPTATLTPTSSVPVFDPAALGDNRLLASFILTKKDKTTGSADVIENTDIIGYIKEPFSAYHLGKTPYRNLDPKYLIGGRFFEKDSNMEFWNVSMEPDPANVDFFLRSPADMRTGYIQNVLSAQFVGQEDFQGIPANHFTFDQTNLREQSDPTGTYKIQEAQGDLYLAQDGNYLLSFHVKLKGNVYSPGGYPGYFPGELEVTEELSSINQLTEITLPADYLAFNLELDLGLPVPTGSRLHAANHSTAGTDYDFYDYFMPATVSKDDFLEFYRNLGPTNGWTVSQVGGTTNYESCQNRDCVILKKGNAKAILAVSDQCVSDIPANYGCFDAIYYK